MRGKSSVAKKVDLQKTKVKRNKTTIRPMTEVTTEGNDETSAVDNGEVAECGCCNKTITAIQKALLCDGCGFWHHTRCEKISEEIYVFLSDHQDEQTIHLFCRKCTVTHTRLFKSVAKIEHNQKLLQEKMDSVLTLITNTKSIEKDEVINHLDQVLANKTGTQDMDTMKQCITGAMDQKLREDKEEEIEHQKRINSVIIHGIPESKEKEPERRVTEDESSIAEVFTGLHFQATVKK